MPKHILTVAVALVVGQSVLLKGAHAEDLGKLLENSARSRFRQALNAPEGGARPEARRPSGEPVAVKTADGWTLVAHRYKPTGRPRTGALPVILCHGLTYNASFWDLDPSCSFAQYLAGLGFDVWAVSLRGCGLSQKWVWRLEDAPEVVIEGALRRLTHGKPTATGFATIDPRYANWNMDDHIAQDVPAFVRLVRRHTRAPAVAWVGHSMGGIVALGCLARYENPGIGCLVTVGSQVTMPEGQVARQFLVEMVQTRRKQLAGQLGKQEIMTQTKTSVQNLFFNEQNVDPRVYAALSGWATDIPALGLMEQYMVLSNRGVLIDAKGQFNYARAVGNIKVPIFISCGERDNFAPLKVQQFLYDHVGSTDKTLHVFGSSSGLSVDAGHDDALVGLNSKTTSYPVIARWLASHGHTAR